MSGQHLEKDERDSPQYLNYLFLHAFLGVCDRAGMPKNALETIQTVIDAHAYDIPPRLRREAEAMSSDFAMRILEEIEESIRTEVEDELSGEDDEEDNRGRDWVPGLVSFEQADANKAAWRSALINGKSLKIRYVSDTSGDTTRIVKPTGIRGPYGEAFCLLRKDDRVFRFDRILALQII